MKSQNKLANHKGFLSHQVHASKIWLIALQQNVKRVEPLAFRYHSEQGSLFKNQLTNLMDEFVCLASAARVA